MSPLGLLLRESECFMQNSKATCQARARKHTRQPRQRNSTGTRQLDSYSTPRRMESASTGSTGTRQEEMLDRQGLDSPSTAASTAPRRSLDSSTLDSQGSTGQLPLQVQHRCVAGAPGSTFDSFRVSFSLERTRCRRVVEDRRLDVTGGRKGATPRETRQIVARARTVKYG